MIYDQDKLRQNIACMRDKGIIIVSPQGKCGYKIPNSINDMIMFYNRYQSSIIPMLRRIQTSNELILLKIVNEINILKNAPEFTLTQALIDATIKNKI